MTADLADLAHNYRAVLDSIERPQVFARTIGDQVIRLGQEFGAAFELPEFSKDRPDFLRWTWRKPHYPIWVEIVDDGEITTRWLVLSSDDLALLEHFRDALLPALPLAPFDRLVGEAETLAPRALVRLALGTNDGPRPDVTNLLCAGLRDTDIEVRARAAEAMFVLRWKSFRPAIEAALRHENDAGLAAMLRTWLQEDAADGRSAPAPR